MDAANIVIALPAARRRNFGTVLAVVAALAIALVFWTQ
jgi:hypothetical protein